MEMEGHAPRVRPDRVLQPEVHAALVRPVNTLPLLELGVPRVLLVLHLRPELPNVLPPVNPARG